MGIYSNSSFLNTVPHGCPCGYFADPRHACRCTAHQIHRYRSKISGPLLDRIDIHVEVPAVPHKDLMVPADTESSDAIRQRVVAARQMQILRFKRTKIYCNAQMASRHIRTHCRIGDDAAGILESAIDRLGLSARAYNRILKISRTIADLDRMTDIQIHHVTEAIQYRSLDRSMQHL
jgi:magnesium chelatase family protein